MRIRFYKYYKKDAELVVFHLLKCGIKSEIVGSIRDKGHSNNDIDIYLPEMSGTIEDCLALQNALFTNNNDALYYQTITDRGGRYYKTKLFGDIDCFFKQHTKEYYDNES